MNYKIRYRSMIFSWILLIGYLITFSLGYLQSIDTTSYHFLSSLMNDQMTSFMIAVTFFGSWIAVVTICIICLVINLKKGLFISINVAIVWITNNIIKLIVARPRPTVLHLVREDSFSFPSAHAMVSFALFAMIAYFLWKKYKPISILVMILVLLIGISRIYLGVHYTSDVIGGYLFALTYLCTFLPILKYHKILPDT